MKSVKLVLGFFIISSSFLHAIEISERKLTLDENFFNSDSEADYQKLKAAAKDGGAGVKQIKASDLTAEDIKFIKDARVFDSTGASAVEDVDMTKTIYILPDDKIMNKTDFEMNLEAKVEKAFEQQNGVVKVTELRVSKIKSEKIQELEKTIQNEEADYNAYVMSLNRVVRRTEGNRYTDVALQQAKLEIVETKKKFEIRKRSLEAQIEEIRAQKVPQDFVKLDEDFIRASGSAIIAGQQLFEELKKSYYTTKNASQNDFYRKLDILKREFKENEKKFERYYELESDVIVKKITTKQKGE